MNKAALTFALALLLGATGVWAGDGTVLRPQGAELIKDQYIVQFNRGANPHALAAQLAAVHGGRVERVFQYALTGAVFNMTEQQAQALSHNPNVVLVEQDALSYVVATQSPATWGLDRVDQRNLPLNNTYNYDFTGAGVNVYVLDTGIRTTHTNFGGRASWGLDCTGEGQSDGHGHGTHVAGTVGSATYGVAKGANLIAVKVCTSGGSCPNSAITCGIDFVVQQKQNNPSIPMVANMSLGGPFSSSENTAVNNAVNDGIVFAVAAGNENTNACNRSPASAANAYTIGSTTSSDARSSFSNFGTCVDTFAPGSSITSTWNTSNTATNTISGTSMASPHAAGAAALVLDENPTWTPFQVMDELDLRATTGVLSGIGSGSPNALLYTLGVAPPPPPPPPPGDCLHAADFESGAGGWVQGSSTCSTGHFVVGSPDFVSDGGVTTQVSGGSGSANAFFTQPNTGGAGTDDVDGGTCEALSPVVNASGESAVEVTLDYFHGQRDAGDDPADGFSIEVLNNGSVVATIVDIGDVTNNAAWTPVSATVSNPGNIQIRVRASDASGPGDLVEGGVDNVLICPTDPPPPGGCTVEEDFEVSATGWFNDGASTCSTGAYVRTNPTQVVDGGVTTQVGGSHSGTNSVFTATNSSAGVNDVDGGNCILGSPTWSVADASTLSVWYFHGQRDAGDDPSGDFFRLEYSTNGGSSWNTLVSNGDSTSNAAWTQATASIPAGSTVALRVQCSDGSGPGDLVECGIDDVSICSN